MPVLFDPRVASTLLGHFAGAISGAAVARKSSFLHDKLGERRCSRQGSRIVDDPLRLRGLRSRPFDGEGLRVSRQDLVDGRRAQQLDRRQRVRPPARHSSRPAMPSRGVGGAPGAGPSNSTSRPGSRSREELIAGIPEAMLVTELIGQGVNGVTGDYSRGAAGFLVRDGEIAEPVAEITIASNLHDMFATLEPASDLDFGAASTPDAAGAGNDGGERLAPSASIDSPVTCKLISLMS